MEIKEEQIRLISKKYGEAFYVLDTECFKKNYNDLQTAMRKYYKKTYISYSYKTNYIPRLCNIVNELGGYAEVVSDMEEDLALKIGVPYNKIIFNGPYKDKYALEKSVIQGAYVNMDSEYDLEIICSLAKKNPNKNFNIGIRCNFDIGDGLYSRFGFDCESKSFVSLIKRVQEIHNINLAGFHCHFASRDIDTWKTKVNKIIKIIKEVYKKVPEYISVGGGIFGRMEETLKKQFNVYIPSFEEYADIIAKVFAINYGMYPEDVQPKLFIEPGSALAGDAMQFVSKVINIKNIRGKNIATLLGSVYNINPTLNGKNPPINIVNFSEGELYNDLDFAGYTCIESDYLYKGFKGNLAEGDYVIFNNVGSYSIVLKPPFILPNFPVIEMDRNEVCLVKREEKFDDIFRTYSFEKVGRGKWNELFIKLDKILSVTINRNIIIYGSGGEWVQWFYKQFYGIEVKCIIDRWKVDQYEHILHLMSLYYIYDDNDVIINTNPKTKGPENEFNAIGEDWNRVKYSNNQVIDLWDYIYEDNIDKYENIEKYTVSMYDYLEVKNGIEILDTCQRKDVKGIGSHGYYPTDFRLIYEVFVESGLFNKQDIILDCGCGKGASLIGLFECGYKKLGGIEYTDYIYNILVSNMYKMGIDCVTVKHTDVSDIFNKGVVCYLGDATLLSNELDLYNVFFFFNPFSYKLFEIMFENILQSMDRIKRKVKIFYAEPMCHNLIINSGKFKYINSFGSKLGGISYNANVYISR